VFLCSWLLLAASRLRGEAGAAAGTGTTEAATAAADVDATGPTLKALALEVVVGSHPGSVWDASSDAFPLSLTRFVFFFSSVFHHGHHSPPERTHS
jgi:hypothetical protein